MSNKESVRIWGYGNYASSNYGVNAMAMSIGSVTVYFSYKTAVAFESPKTGLVICKNVWGTTTGKHLNWIDRDKSIRGPRGEFLEKLGELAKAISVHVV